MERCDIRWAFNTQARTPNAGQHEPDFLSAAAACRARRFHRTLPGYQPTRLCSLRGLARALGVEEIWVKDESDRFGLQSFKVLGASYAVSRCLSDRLGAGGMSLPFDELRSLVEEGAARVTLATATDGNHGRALAWTGRQLGLPVVVYLPSLTTSGRVKRISDEGARTIIVDGNYDAAVLQAERDAVQDGWVLVQDTAWEGYEDIPRWIMQGYGTLVDEIHEQVDGQVHRRFTHVLIQAGVGSLAGALQGYLHSLGGADRPLTVILEPLQADCLLRSMEAHDPSAQVVSGELDTIMAGLACGRPNPLGWEILRSYADAFAACGDNLAALGMRLLGNPLPGDPRIVSGESGAVGAGFLYAVMTHPDFAPLKERLGVGPTSRLLVINTEGDTDPISYRNIVWNGAFPCNLRKNIRSVIPVGRRVSQPVGCP